MKSKCNQLLLASIILAVGLFFTGCTSTRSSNGVTIEQNRAAAWGNSMSNAISKLWPW